MKHIRIAQKLMDEKAVRFKDRDLAYLRSRKEFNEYVTDLLWAQDFALLNREEMMDRVMTEPSYLFFKEDGHQKEIEIERIDCHHNFTQRENHFNDNVWIIRKGAIQMKLGQKGVIPGSMGTRSYIVSGLENKMAYHSAPHGAGRRFSRGEARRRFTMADFEKAMAGIRCRHSAKLIDEITGAYKDIDEVMENSRELVTVEHSFRRVNEHQRRLITADRGLSDRVDRSWAGSIVNSPTACYQHLESGILVVITEGVSPARPAGNGYLLGDIFSLGVYDIFFRRGFRGGTSAAGRGHTRWDVPIRRSARPPKATSWR